MPPILIKEQGFLSFSLLIKAYEILVLMVLPLHHLKDPFA